MNMDTNFLLLSLVICGIPSVWAMDNLNVTKNGNCINYSMESQVDGPAPTDPKEIVESALRGHAREMRTLLTNYLAYAHYFDNKNNQEEATKRCDITADWYCRLMIRLQQDVACSTDPSAKAAYEQIVIPFFSAVNTLRENVKTVINSYLEDLDRKKNAVAWVSERTNKAMPSPEWVVDQFGMNKFLRAFGDPNAQSTAVIDKSLWLKTRQDVLEKCRKELNIDNTEGSTSSEK